MTDPKKTETEPCPCCGSPVPKDRIRATVNEVEDDLADRRIQAT